MYELRRIVAVLTLSAIVLAFAAPALAQTQGMPMASPGMMPGRMQEGMQGGMQGGMMPVEQSGKDMMATMTDMKDISIPASIMKSAGLEGMMMPGEMYTLFVASDAALKTMSPDMMNKMAEKVKDRQMATEFVKGHLISGMVTPEEMTDGKTLTMMNGITMTVRKTDGRMMVDDANIIKAVKTGNGMLYVMDRIPSSIATMMEKMDMIPMSAMSASR